MMKKRMFAMAMILSMVTASLAGCGGNSADEPATKETTVESNGGNAAEPITLTIGYLAMGTANGKEIKDLEWMKQIEKDSGVSFEYEEYADKEALNLMFASRDYPDILLNGANDKQTSDAVAAGDIYALDEYMDEYAPIWAKYLDGDSYVKKIITYDDGHIYSIPLVNYEATTVGLRDQWFIRQDWLNELGLDMPATTDELYEVLAAFRDNAGKGSIPENVIPYLPNELLRNALGGVLELVGGFYGVSLSNEKQLVTVDDNGQIEFNYNNELLKGGLEFLHKLTKEELIPKDAFTDTSNWRALVGVDPSVDDTARVGLFSTYQNPDSSFEKIVPMPPLSGNGATPIVRAQSSIVSGNKFLVFTVCKYPETAMSIANMMAEEERSIAGYFGTIDGYYVTKKEDGTYLVNKYPSDDEYKVSPRVRTPLLLSEALFEKVEYAKDTVTYQRYKAIEEIYSEYVLPIENMWPAGLLISSENTDRISELKTDLASYISSSWAKWALNGGIEEEWNDYCKQLESLGLEEYLTLLQEELDAFNKK